MAKAVGKGRLDALINNAGMTNDWDPIIEGDTEMCLKCWDLHIKATYLILKSFLPLFMETYPWNHEESNSRSAGWQVFQLQFRL